jgi:excisionase family DNA binding protein
MPQTPPLSVAQAADEHNIPKRTLQHAITKGDLKAHKLPGTTGAYILERTELDRWLTTRRTTPATTA